MDRNREIAEAIRAGERALSSLRDAQRYLNSAGNWGILDIFGGNLLSGMMKHSRINDAQRSMNEARRDLRSFSRELEDVDMYLPDVRVNDFLTFADFFFDGLIADAFVQSKISEAQRQVADAIRRVEQILMRLRSIR